MHSLARTIAKKILRTAVTKQSERRRKLQVETLEHRLTPTGIYSGVVFQDFNSNGTRDLTTTIANVGVGTIPVAAIVASKELQSRPSILPAAAKDRQPL